MKYLILPVCLLLCFNLYGQRKKRAKSNTFLKIQGGFLYDAHPNNDYAGFNILNLGWMKVKEKKMQGIELELIGYKSDLQLEDGESFMSPMNGGIFGPPPKGWAKERHSIELSYFRSSALIGDIENGLFLGPIGSVGIINTEFFPTATTDFPIADKCYCLGLGMKADYSLHLAKRLYLNASTRLTIFDLGILETRIQRLTTILRQQTSTNFDFNLIRKQFPLMLGLAFKL